ncbi:MAG TPA: hypothetical protein ENK18_17445, partial [Deltaproteobacteria bacterium]|nr:hypothetical protein [Deltaproteobacteria bacterium]
YLNARPLSERIDIDQHPLVMAPPAEVARMLRDDEVDVALVPVAAALTDGDFRIVPGVAIGAQGPVRSVLLVAETPPEQWRAVRLDGVSRTSAVLARLLLAGPLSERVPPGLRIEAVGPNEALAGAGGDVAALVIGDAALALDARWSVRLDLAELWHEWTELPFVFAVWAARPDLDPAVVDHLVEAGRAGVEALPRAYAGDDLRYLTESLRYPLDDAALMGLRRFAALARAEGWLGREDIELFGPSRPRLDHPPVAGLLQRAVAGERLGPDALHRLALHAPLAQLAAAAHELRCIRHPGGEVGYWLEASMPDPEGIAEIVVGGGVGVVEQLLALREAQDRDGAVTGVRVWAAEGEGPYGDQPNTAIDHQRAVALARIALDNVPHCCASVGTEGLGMAQASLGMGCDQLGRICLEGDPGGWAEQVEAIEHHIREAGFEPVRLRPSRRSTPQPTEHPAP